MFFSTAFAPPICHEKLLGSIEIDNNNKQPGRRNEWQEQLNVQNKPKKQIQFK